MSLMWTLAFIIPVIITEIGECSSRIAQWAIKIAACTLGIITTHETGRIYREQWLYDLQEMPGKLTKLLLTLSMLVRAVPRLWWIIQGEDIPGDIFRRLGRIMPRWRRASSSPKPGVQLIEFDKRRVGIRARGFSSSVIYMTKEQFREFLAWAKEEELAS